MNSTSAQDTPQILKGKVIESGTKAPLMWVIVSSAKSGKIAETNEAGEFELEVPDLQSEIIVNFPGYDSRKIFINGKESLTIALVPSRFKSIDDPVFLPEKIASQKDMVQNVTSIDMTEIQKLRLLLSTNLFRAGFQA
ncbi:MAG: hypothetical protein HC906_00330 [Bacteroidales bacterium]|nr:hypothetical protein [Bacteroidales bacterium]